MGALARAILSVGRMLLSKGFRPLIALIRSFTKDGFKAGMKSLLDALHGFFTKSLEISGFLMLIELGIKKILGYLGLLTAAGSGALGAKQVFDFGKAVLNPQSQMLDWLSEAFATLPNVNDIIESIDDIMSRLTQGYFHPPITMTYLLQVTAAGECFNQYLQALISTLIFVFSIFLVRWAFGQNFTFTSKLPTKT